MACFGGDSGCRVGKWIEWHAGCFVSCTCCPASHGRQCLDHCKYQLMSSVGSLIKKCSPETMTYTAIARKTTTPTPSCVRRLPVTHDLDLLDTSCQYWKVYHNDSNTISCILGCQRCIPAWFILSRLLLLAFTTILIASAETVPERALFAFIGGSCGTPWCLRVSDRTCQPCIALETDFRCTRLAAPGAAILASSAASALARSNVRYSAGKCLDVDSGGYERLSACLEYLPYP